MLVGQLMCAEIFQANDVSLCFLHLLFMQIVMPSTAYETGNTSKLLGQITCEFPRVHISAVNRRYFNEEKGSVQWG